MQITGYYIVIIVDILKLLMTDLFEPIYLFVMMYRKENIGHINYEFYNKY